MRIVYMGTPEFAVLPLERLCNDGHDIAAVFTQPDKPRNRGMTVSFSPVKEAALTRSLPVIQPASLKDDTVAQMIRGLEPDVIIAVAYGKLFPKNLLDLTPFGCLNIHASLLPKYRGAAPIQWAILNGETETGVTSMVMSEGMDSGDILFSKKVHIWDDETAGELHDKLSITAAQLLSETIEALTGGLAVGMPQEHDAATYAPMLTREMSMIDWTEPAINIKRKVRGLNPWPAATAQLGGKTCKILAVDIENKDHSHAPGDIVISSRRAIEVACIDGIVIIRELQAPGGKRMTSAEYLRGHFIGGCSL